MSFYHLRPPVSLSLSPFLPSSANTHPPVLRVNGSLLVPIAGSVPLPPTLLQVKDPDSPPEWLVFHLVQGPGNGQLVLFRGEEEEETAGRRVTGRELSKDDTFTWAELSSGRLRLRHQKDKPRSVVWFQKKES